MKPTSWIEISRANLWHNVEQFAALINPETKLFAVVKGNAYGHGQTQIVQILNDHPAVAGFMVFEIGEALALHKLTAKPIAVLGYAGDDTATLNQAAKDRIILPLLYLTDATRLAQIIKGSWLGQIKIDVGTGRLGIPHLQAADEIEKIIALNNVAITGIYSHFSDSENDNQEFTQEQFHRFQAVLNQLKQRNINLTNNHLACTAAILRNRDFHLDSVRLGLGLYGLEPYDGANTLALRPVLSWKTSILQVRNLQAGETIGYGLSYKAKKDAQLVTIPVGYYDGYDRRLSNQGNIIIDNETYPIIGRICMNVCMAEIPAGVMIKSGQEVTLIGEKFTVDTMASLCQTINYEITTRINPLLPRIIV